MRLLTVGGGTAGHMLPLVALIEEFRQQEGEKRRSCHHIAYVGEGTAFEKQIFRSKHVKMYKIQAGKLRRYFSMKNFLDAAKVPLGIFQSIKIINNFKPDVIFSKGGYVSVPVVIAGAMCGIPIIIHESDSLPGLATKIASIFAKKICVGFEETAGLLPCKKVIITGTPLRKEITQGSIAKARALTGFKKELPVTLIMGGSLGAEKINNAVHAALKKLLKETQIIHITGKGKTINTWHLSKSEQERYKQCEFVTKEMPHFYKLADLVVSRAGANSLAEIEALKKPNILIPLSRGQSRGDQIANAEIFKRANASMVIQNSELCAKILENKILQLLKDKNLQEEMKKGLSNIQSSKLASKKIKEIILNQIKK